MVPSIEPDRLIDSLLAFKMASTSVVFRLLNGGRLSVLLEFFVGDCVQDADLLTVEARITAETEPSVVFALHLH